MKTIVFKDGDTADITEREFLIVLNSFNERKGVYVSRLQKYVNPFEVKTIDAIEHQLEYGRPYKLFSDEDQDFKPGRYFVDSKTKSVLLFPSTTGMKAVVVGNYEDLKNNLFSEDDYLDELGKKLMEKYPNNLLVNAMSLPEPQS